VLARWTVVALFLGWVGCGARSEVDPGRESDAGVDGRLTLVSLPTGAMRSAIVLVRGDTCVVVQIMYAFGNAVRPGPPALPPGWLLEQAYRRTPCGDLGLPTPSEGEPATAVRGQVTFDDPDCGWEVDLVLDFADGTSETLRGRTHPTC